MTKWATLLLSAALLFISVPQHMKAEEVMATSDQMPYVTLFDEYTLYTGKETKANQAIGKLSAMQTVHLAPIDRNQLLGITNMEKVEVETWLGNVWINMKEGSFKYGRIKVQEQPLTLLEEETIYDAPNKSTPYRLSPQKVQTVASMDICDPYTPCSSKDQWYLIQTSWLGDKWIRPYHYEEKYQGTPVEGMISIEQETEVYRLPFEKTTTEEPKLKPQIIKPLQKYSLIQRMTPPSIWYQIETSKGLRWITFGSSHGLGYENIIRIDQQVEIPFPFYYLEVPQIYSQKLAGQQPPQTVHAIGQREGLYFVVVGNTGQWINLAKDMALHITGDFAADSKLGVKQSEAVIQLTDKSIALDTPYVDGSLTEHILTFTPQSVTASREWKSPAGEVWYYIHTWQGAKWVRP
ncbi:hypothetical protein GCM10008018_67070 [Paenibacillus marchantiophytorum]|uniref:SH3 domain-containing protein n=1 Tax=Paenibacillus marchantiophytorum TaxID=1619310 RepID=A0ABQ1FGR2_9BACL|nr:hypothetical protein [Paenibacillus marchantiophytorum]GGA12628.1 hypothetical protein GCM10008018_67070 [Paenibacillus marchantiophytorum]